MQALLVKFMEMFIKFAVVPLLSKLIVSIVDYFQEKKDKADRDEKIDKAINDFKEAKTSKEKEDAFFALVRGHKPS